MPCPCGSGCKCASQTNKGSCNCGSDCKCGGENKSKCGCSSK
ncbi:metallothionein A [Drosophila willistoni]|uniref:Metallothionein A n=1 Tax=Drosophila willistoni TaxID=7260 RepID=B4N809_DROWI|nr:metallothionein-1 [Drosophila willistoni]EDW81260.1 metallothionein A [Drosophila willistoni]